MRDGGRLAGSICEDELVREEEVWKNKLFPKAKREDDRGRQERQVRGESGPF